MRPELSDGRVIDLAYQAAELSSLLIAIACCRRRNPKPTGTPS